MGRKQWCPGWESNPVPLLKRRKLLILRVTDYAKNAKSAKVGYAAGMRGDGVLGYLNRIAGIQNFVQVREQTKSEYGVLVEPEKPATRLPGANRSGPSNSFIRSIEPEGSPPLRR